MYLQMLTSLDNVNNTTMINTKWLQWFIGLMDAEGNFQVFPKKRENGAGKITSYSVGIGIHLGMHIRELAMILNIQAQLGGIGRIYEYHHKNEVHYAITARNEIQQFISLVFSEYSLLTVHQQQRFALLNHVVQNDIRKVWTREQYDTVLSTNFDGPVLTNLDPGFVHNWIAGFINGEGSFNIGKEGSVFSFSLEHTDKPVLELMRNAIGLSLATYDRKQRGVRKLTYVVQVSSVVDVDRVVDFLGVVEPMQGHKLVQYTEWRDKWLTKRSDK